MLGLITSMMSNSLAEEREAQARRENYYYGELAAKNADKRTRALYNDLQSPKALLEQYKEANLSPSLMFSGGGVGGQTSQGAQGTGAAGVSPTTYGIQTPLESAQTALTLAQTKKTQEETKTVDETRTPTVKNLEADLNKKIAETENTTLKNVWQEFSNSVEMLELQFNASTIEQRINQFLTNGELLLHKTKSAKIKSEIDEETQKDAVMYVKEQTKNLIADTILKKAQKRLTEKGIELQDKQIEDLANQIVNRSEQININRESLSAQIEQWAKENNFTEQKLAQELTNIIWSNYNDSMHNVLDFLKLIVSAY